MTRDRARTLVAWLQGLGANHQEIADTLRDEGATFSVDEIAEIEDEALGRM